MGLFYLKVFIEPHWGWLLTYAGLTKSRPALRAIPPTTLIGALAYPLCLELGLPEVRVLATGKRVVEVSQAELLRGAVVSVNASMRLAAVPYSDLSKIVLYDARRKTLKTDAVAVEKVYASPGELRVVYVLDPERAREALGGGWERRLASAAYSIVRLGSKESLVSVRRVEWGWAEPVDGEVETEYYFPLQAAEPGSIRGTYFVAMFVDWRRVSIGEYLGAPRVPVVVPYDLERLQASRVRLSLRSGFEAVRAGGEQVVLWGGASGGARS